MPAHPGYPRMGVVIGGSARVFVPEGRFLLRVERGTEYRRVEIPLEAKPGDSLEQTVRLERWINMRGKGWWSSDMHVHREPADMAALVEASDVHLAPTQANDRTMRKSLVGLAR